MFLGIGVGRVYSGAVLPMFLLYYLVFRSRKCLEKILFWSGPFLNKFSGANFCLHNGNRTVTVPFPPSRRGKCCPFFSFCVFLCPVRCLLSFFCRSSFLRVVVWKNFRERTFVFGCRCGSCVFWCCFAYVFALFLLFRSRNCLEKILLMSGLVFLGCLLSSFGCFADVVVFFFFFFF